MFFLWREFRRGGRDLGAVIVPRDSPFLLDFIAYHLADIRQFQPDFHLAEDDDVIAMLLPRAGLPAGLLVGRRHDATLSIDLDYVLGPYRDSRIGQWIFRSGSEVFGPLGIDRLTELQRAVVAEVAGAPVKETGRALDATINDVLVSCLAGSLERYLRSHGAFCASTTFMVPVNLKPLNAAPSDELGNAFALIYLEMPTSEPDPMDVLEVVKRRMARMKHGHEPAVQVGVHEQALVGLTDVEDELIDLIVEQIVEDIFNKAFVNW